MAPAPDPRSGEQPRAFPGPTLGGLGEGALLARLLPILQAGGAGLGPGHGVQLGPGDDAAWLAPAPRGTLISVDAVVQGQDYLDQWPCGLAHDPRDIGFKSIAQNLSDINAMGGVPEHLLLSFQGPQHLPALWVEDFARGMREALEELRSPDARPAAVVGGDLGVAAEVSSTVTVLGSPAVGGPVTRAGARPGHVIAVAGALGFASRGLELLLGEAPVSREHPCVQRQFRPRPPMQAGPEAAPSATAMMDVSDGLLADLARLLRASAAQAGCALGARLSAAALQPWAQALVEANAGQGTPLSLAQAHRHVLTGGEDFALLAVFPTEAIPQGFRAVGKIVRSGSGEPDRRGPGEGADPEILIDGRPWNGQAGFDHFG